MGREVNLMINYPRSKTNIQELKETKAGLSELDYHPHFWQPVVPTFKMFYGLTEKSSVLDIGCAKGFMIYDFINIIPGIKVRGIDISSYAIENAIEPVQDFVSVGDARKLEFEDNSFDLVVSITTLHNFDKEECAAALQEIERVSKGKSFITVYAYRNDEEKAFMRAWNSTAKTIMHQEEWRAFFKKVGYTGDYYWVIP